MMKGGVVRLLVLLAVAACAGARNRPAHLVSHFYNEALLLPHWIRHHAPMFSSAILIDYNSTDGSAEIVRRLAPRSWKVVLSVDAEFDAATLDQQVVSWEMAQPNAWRIALTTTEFLIMPHMREKLAALDPGADGHRVLRFHSVIVVGDDAVPLNDEQPLVCQRAVFVEPQRGLLLGAAPKTNKPFYDRFMHAGLGSNYDYEPGRHAMLGAVTAEENNLYSDTGLIFKYMWTPWPETRARKMQIGTKVSKSDRKAGSGVQHTAMERLTARKADEYRNSALRGVERFDANGLERELASSEWRRQHPIPKLALELFKSWACGEGLARGNSSRMARNTPA